MLKLEQFTTYKLLPMNVNNIKRVLDNSGIWYSCLAENEDVCIDEVTTVPCLQSEMHRKLFVLTTGNIKEAEQAVFDWNGFANVLLDTGCTKYLRKLSPLNLILVGSGDIGKAVGVLNEAMR